MIKRGLRTWFRRYGYSTESLLALASCVLLSAMAFEFHGTSSAYAWLAENAFARSGAVVILLAIVAGLTRYSNRVDTMLKRGEARTAGAMNLHEKYRQKFNALETQAAGVDLSPLQRQEMEQIREQAQQLNEMISEILRDGEETIVEGVALKRKFFEVEAAILSVGTLVWGFGDLLFRCPFCSF